MRDEWMVFRGVRGNLLSFESSIKLKLFLMTCLLETEDRIKSAAIIEDFKPEKIRTKEQNLYWKHILEKYPEVFFGKVVTMRGVELKLQINQDIKPTQAACRPIPIHLREKVEREIDRMIADDIIEPASGPMSWISELVILEKEDQPG